MESKELEVEKILKEKGINYRLLKLTQNAYTIGDVMKYSEEEIDPEEICKTIILRGKKSGKKTALLLRGSDKVNFPEAKRILGEEMTIATEKEVKEAANVEPGAVCPFLLNVPLLVDKKVLDLKRMNCGSGNHFYGLEFEVNDLIKALEYQVVDLNRNSLA